MSKAPLQQHYVAILTTIVILAAALRFGLAPQTNLESRGDALLFQLWGYSANVNGLTNVYTHEIVHPAFAHIALPNYLPPYLTILQGLSWAHHHLEAAPTVGTSLASVIFKTPAILAELATILLLATIVRRRAGEGWGLAVAGVYAVHPAIVFTTAAWGQVDAFSALAAVLCVLALERKQYTWATVAWVAGFFFKMQVVAILPLLLWELYQNLKLKDFYRPVLAGLGTALLATFPFVLAGKTVDVLHVITGVAGQYPYPSANAYNFWWLFSGGHWVARNDATMAFLGLSAIRWGAVLFFAAGIFALWFRKRTHAMSESLWLTATFLAFSFFMLPTEMHERYLFPFFALLLPVLPALKKSRWLFGILSVTFLWNLIVAFLVIGVEANQQLGNFWGGSLIVAIVNVAAFAATVVWYVQMARHRHPV